jgi:hypothetical protein
MVWWQHTGKKVVSDVKKKQLKNLLYVGRCCRLVPRWWSPAFVVVIAGLTCVVLVAVLVVKTLAK